MGKNQIVPFIGKKLANGISKYYLVKVTGHKNNNVMNIMDISTGKIATRTLYNTGKAVDTLSMNPIRIAKTIGNVSKLLITK